MKRKYMLTISGISIYSIFFLFQLAMALIFIFPIIALLFSIIVIFVLRYYSQKKQSFGLLYIKSYLIVTVSSLFELLITYLYHVVFLNEELLQYIDEEEIYTYTYTSVDYIFIFLVILFTTLLTCLWIKNKEKQKVGLKISFVIVIVYTGITYMSIYLIDTLDNKTQNNIDNNITVKLVK